MRVFLLLLAAALHVACSVASNHRQVSDQKVVSQGPQISSSAAGLAFVGVDERYQSSGIYWYDFSSGALSRPVGGQSGDALLVYQPSLGLLLFNRRPASENLSLLGAAPQFQLGKQIAFRGNPHFALRLKNGHLVIGLYNEGRILQIDPADWTTIASYDAASAGVARFRPSDALLVELSTGPVLYVLHHGLDDKHRCDGSQRILAFEVVADRLKLMDRNLPIRASSAQFLHRDEYGVEVMGLCTEFLKKHGCTAGLEYLDFERWAMVNHSDIRSLPFELGGQLTPGFSIGEAFADLKDPASSRRFVARLYSGDRQVAVTPLADLPPESGSFMIHADPDSRTLFYGKWDKETGAALGVVASDGSSHQIPLRDVPYQGVLVPR